MAVINSFMDYDKISDTIMYFTSEVSLKFVVNLSRKNKSGDRTSFHSEYGYMSNYTNRKSYSIKRNISCFFSVDDCKDFNNSIIIRPQDVILLKMIMDNNIIPWFIGNTRIYDFDKSGKLILKGKWSPADFPLSDYKFMSFMPIVITYQDGTLKEGIRIIINDKNNFIDIDINKFFEFYYYICNTDMYNAAATLLNYVKCGPYEQNYFDMQTGTGSNNGDKGYNNESNEWSDLKGKSGKKNAFFDSL